MSTIEVHNQPDQSKIPVTVKHYPEQAQPNLEDVPAEPGADSVAYIDFERTGQPELVEPRVEAQDVAVGGVRGWVHRKITAGIEPERLEGLSGDRTRQHDFLGPAPRQRTPVDGLARLQSRARTVDRMTRPRL